MAKAIITADLHLTSRPEDRYRFKIFEFLAGLANKDRLIRYLMILGDFTDKKDNHDSWLVNQIVEHLVRLSTNINSIYLLYGNHDGYTASQAFFSFLPLVSDSCIYITRPKMISYARYDRRVLFIPHTREPMRVTDVIPKDGKPLHYIFMHQTVHGARASNGAIMQGLPVAAFAAEGFTGRIFSGDIHVPQTIGPVTYVGAPYHIRFGDSYDPRVIILDFETGECESVPVTGFPRKHMLDIRSPDEISQHVNKGDQVKVRFWLNDVELTDWRTLREACEKACERLGVELFGVEFHKRRSAESSQDTEKICSTVKSTDEDLLRTYCERERLSKSYFDAGVSILKEDV